MESADSCSESGGSSQKPIVLNFPPERPGWEWTLSLSWIAGGLALWLPFFLFWRMGPGNFGNNIANGFGFFICGGAAASIWVLLCRRITAGNRIAGKICGWGMFFSTLLLIPTGFGMLPFSLGITLVYLLVFVPGAAAAYRFKVPDAKARLSAIPEYAMYRFFRSNRPWNVCFWAFLLLLYSACDAYRLRHEMDAEWFAKLSIFAARFGTHLMVVAILALAVRFVRSVLPRKAAWFADFVVSLTIGLTLIDMVMIEMWQNPVIPFINGLTNSGTFDIQQELAASGLGIGPIFAGLVLLLFALGCFAFYGLLALASRVVIFRPSAATLLITAILGWSLAAAEQAISKAWKPKDVWQAEVATFPFQVGPLRPESGYANYRVEFVDPYGTIDTETLITDLIAGDEGPEDLPDIYFFMVESFRKDAITPEIAPFLTEFGQSECQQFGQTYAASNCTPLSWFGTLHSRIPVFWTDALREYDSENRPGAYPLRLLKAAGYRLEVRAVSDLSYKDMSALQFGSQHVLADLYKDDYGRSEGFGIGEREVNLFKDLKDVVRSQTTGGNLHFVALDSPHYNYYWPKSFDPPNKEFVENPYFGSSPSPEAIELVVNRYQNSVAWVDYALGNFLQFLKVQGKYENSIIIITGDHGEEFREHDSWFHCSALFNEQTNVPILIKWPSNIGPTPYRNIASHLDIMPTILEGLGFPEKYRIPLAGRSLLSEEADSAILASGWAGRTGISMTIVNSGMKAAFVWSNPWQQRVPNEIKLKEFFSLKDKTLRVIPDFAHDKLLEEFEPTIPGFFHRFEKIE